MAGMCEMIYGYDAGTGGVRVEACTFVAITHYPGVLRVEASHSQGYAGDVLWPYQVLVYDEAEDTYKEACFVDTWKKEITDYDSYRDMPYPEEIDTTLDRSLADHDVGKYWLDKVTSLPRTVAKAPFPALLT